MRKALFAMLMVAAGQALALDYEPLAIDGRARGSGPLLEVYRASAKGYQVTFTDGTNTHDATGETPFMTWYTNQTSGGVVTSSYSVVSAAVGVVNFKFEETDLNHTAGRYWYSVGLTDTNGDLAAYRQGRLVIVGEQYGAGGSTAGFTTNISDGLLPSTITRDTEWDTEAEVEAVWGTDIVTTGDTANVTEAMLAFSAATDSELASTSTADRAYADALVDDLSGVSDAATARTNLGLGTASTNPASAFATAAQGLLADTALQVEGDPVAQTQVWANAQYANAVLTDGSRAMTGDLNMGGNSVTNGAWEGTVIADAYVADNITASSYLPLAGGTMSGNIKMGATRAITGSPSSGATSLYMDLATVDQIFMWTSGGFFMSDTNGQPWMDVNRSYAQLQTNAAGIWQSVGTATNGNEIVNYDTMVSYVADQGGGGGSFSVYGFQRVNLGWVPRDSVTEGPSATPTNIVISPLTVYNATNPISAYAAYSTESTLQSRYDYGRIMVPQWASSWGTTAMQYRVVSTSTNTADCYANVLFADGNGSQTVSNAVSTTANQWSAWTDILAASLPATMTNLQSLTEIQVVQSSYAKSSNKISFVEIKCDFQP